ncbi:WD40 repeat protein [Silvibacterium bohemicum]|uniref:WD40 repeat protein n=1 Tax=Silvibacterium bohemicum TaxID=1577686 RepID=A0A841JPK5_9BACT|nr:PD40 domain-containing protein [Silvibacterium bohemicum]MBB6143243.1 WD40 repeat protein [Silvibacterium bohemicum]
MQLVFVRPILAIAAIFLSLANLASASSDKLIYERSENQWYMSWRIPMSVSPDGSWALFHGGPENMHLYSIRAGSEENETLTKGMDVVEDAAFCGSGSSSLARRGRRGSETGWFFPGEEHVSSLPAQVTLACSQDGRKIAYFDSSAPDRKLFVGSQGNYRPYSPAGTVTAMAFSADARMFYYLAYDSNAETTLFRIVLSTGEPQAVVNHLDASRLANNIALAPDGKSAYLTLASDSFPENAARHQPHAARWLKIYQVDFATGTRRLVVDSPGENNASPALAAGFLYWNHKVIQDTIVTIPTEGGVAKNVIAGGAFPMWNPDGSQIGYFFGDLRFADLPLNFDDAVVNVDANANRTSEPRVIVSGYGEDFPPAWSPDGKWIAFHSHRSPTPVPTYASPGTTDDVFLRRANDVHAPEIRLTDFGLETGPAYWSPDGKKLIFVSWKRGGTPGINKLWVLTLDTEKGAVLKTEMLPLSEDILNPSAGMWSPDGKEIAIEDDRGERRSTLWVVRADGSHPEKVIDYEGTTYGGLDWERDGKTLIYSGLAGDHLQLFSVPRIGGTPTQLTHDVGDLLQPEVSPDGKRIACFREVQSNQIWRRSLP